MKKGGNNLCVWDPRDFVTHKYFFSGMLKFAAQVIKNPESLSTPSRTIPYATLRHCGGLLKYRWVFFTLFCKASHRDILCYLRVTAISSLVFVKCYCKCFFVTSLTLLRSEEKPCETLLYIKRMWTPSHSCMFKFNRPQYCCSHKFLRARCSSLALASWKKTQFYPKNRFHNITESFFLLVPIATRYFETMSIFKR